MRGALFQVSLHGYVQNVLRSATEEVNKLDRGLFSDPALGGRLKQIADKFSLDVAKINKDGIAAHAREEEFESHDYGRAFRGKRSLLDVSIPFSGDPDSFSLCPSQSAVIMQRISVGRDAVSLTIPDDNNAQREVDTVVGQLTQNLDRIRTEFEAAKPQIGQAVQQAAERRKAQIASDAERDKGRTFKVQR